MFCMRLNASYIKTPLETLYIVPDWLNSSVYMFITHTSKGQQSLKLRTSVLLKECADNYFVFSCKLLYKNHKKVF